MSMAEEVENAVKVSLAEWGVKHGNNEEHQIFRNNAIQSALNIFNCIYESTSDSEEEDDITKENKLLDEGLPNNLVEAVKYALCQEFKMTKERYYISVDLLKNSNKLPDIAYYPPYFYNQYRGVFEKGKKYDPFKASELNPMTRFERREVERSLYFYHKFADKMFPLGMGYEVVVSLHAEHTNQACLCCSVKGSLQWNGGSSTSSAWRDLVCTNCNSSYEIKSKETNDKITREFERNRINGGSYTYFQKVRYDKSAQYAKQYLVIVNRETMWVNENPVWQVHISEIEYVLPTLSYHTFTHQNMRKIRFKSKVKVIPRTKKLWFEVPAKRVDWQGIARSVYKNHFPKENWNSAKEKLDAVLDPENGAMFSRGPAPSLLAANDFASRMKNIDDKIAEDCTINLCVGTSAPLLASKLETPTEINKNKEDFDTNLKNELKEFNEGVEDWEDLVDD